jgi:hypothetical protein
MTSAINEIDMKFEKNKIVNIETIGSLSQITRPCPIKYKSMKVQHQQVHPTSVINLSSTSSRYFRTFDLAALICFIIKDFFCFSNFRFSSRFSDIFDNDAQKTSDWTNSSRAI